MALLSSRASLPDELSTFLDQDKIDSFDDLREKVGTKEINFQVPTTYSSSENLVIQSTELRCGIPYFLLTIKTDLTFEGFNCGVRCTMKSLSTNRITIIDRCSKLIEAVRYLSTLELDDKKLVLLEQISCMNSLCHAGEKKYTPEMIGRAFEYFAISRSLYRRLREDYELPSITMLTKLTSKVSNLDDDFLASFFGNISDVRQKNVTLLIDEIYVKPSLTYQGGNIFGKAVNKPSHMAKTVLSFMICCMFGGKKILLQGLTCFPPRRRISVPTNVVDFKRHKK